MIKKCELEYSPFGNDAQRYKVRAFSTSLDLQKLIDTIPARCSSPFATLSKEYNWAFYIYELPHHNLNNVVQVLKSLSQDWKVLLSEKQDAGSLEAVSRAPMETINAEVLLGWTYSNELNSDYLFSELNVYHGNRFAHAAAQIIAAHPGKIYNPFLICGSRGVGKTHCMQAIAHSIIEKKPQIKMLYVSAAKLAKDFEEALQKHAVNLLLSEYRQRDLFLIEDIELFSEQENIQEEFLHVLNAMQESNKQVILTSQYPELKLTFSERMKNRLTHGLTVQIEQPDFHVKKAILQKQFKNELPREIVEYISQNIVQAEQLLEIITLIQGELIHSGKFLSLMELKQLLFLEEDSGRRSISNSSANLLPSPLERNEPISAPIITSPLSRVSLKETSFGLPELNFNKINSEVIHEINKEVLSDSLSSSSEINQTDPFQKAEKSEFPIEIGSVERDQAQKNLFEEEKINEHSVFVQPLPKVDVKNSEFIPQKSVEMEAGLKIVKMVCLYPLAAEMEFQKCMDTLENQIEKYKLKYKLNLVEKQSYDANPQVQVDLFLQICKNNLCHYLFILMPQNIDNPDWFVPFEKKILSAEIALHVLLWEQRLKETWYLNCALELSLDKFKNKTE